jgi:hypothetical protein
MRNRALLTFIILFLFVAACRKEEEMPTPVPTIAVPTAVPTSTPTPRPTLAPGETPPPGEPLAPTTINPADITWSPQVIDSSPLPGEELLLDGAITIRFDQPMDQTSVEQAMSVAAEEDGTAVAGDFSWPRPDTVIFTPKSELQGKQLYRVSIDERAQGENGRPLETPIQLLLQTAGDLAVSQVLPADNTAGVPTDGAITVMFNRPVVPLVSTGQQADLPQPLAFAPPATGRGEWTSTSIYRFVPDPPLAGATTYNVVVDPTLTDVVGVAMAAPFNWSFTTLDPEVVTIFPDETAAIAPDTTFTVTFNMPMNTAVTEAAISIVGGEELPELSFHWMEDGRVVGVTPTDLLEMETEYEFIVGDTAAAANGQATLAEAASFAYTTYPFPAVISVYPRDGQTAEQWDRGLNIQFASPMNWDTVEGRVGIFPAPAVPPNYYIDPWSNGIQIDFPYQPDTTYRIIIPSTAADPYGNTLSAAYEWTFTSASTPPIASFNLPQNQSFLSTSFPTQVDIVHNNVPAVNVALYNLGLPLNLLSNPWDVQNYTPAGEPVRTWNLEMDSGRNEVGVTNLPLADGGVLPTGIYFLTLNAPGLPEDSQWWQNQNNVLIVADTNVVVKEMFGDVYIWATDIASGQPAANRNLTLYNAQGVQVGTAVTDANGLARFDYMPANGYLEGATVISNAPGAAGFGAGNSTWNGDTAPWQFGLNADSSDQTPNFAYIYTDRPIYRPGDSVFFKGIVRENGYGRFFMPAERQELELHIYYSDFTGQASFDDYQTVTVQPDGTFNGEFVVPESGALGTYFMSLDGQGFDWRANVSFTVAEYRRPEFLVTMTPEMPDALRGETVDVTLQAEYFFGGTAADLPVQWSIYDNAFYPQFPGPYYCWMDCGGFYYEESGPYNFGGGENFLGSGEGVTDGDGRLTITLPADLLQESDPGSRVVRVEATVTDLSGFPITSRTEVTFHAAESYVGVRTLTGFVAAGEEAEVEVKTVDWAGEEVANQDVELVFYRREWEPVRTQDFGLYYTAWIATDTEVARQTVTTDAQGVAQATFTPDQGGSYLAVATVTDDTGRMNLSSTYVWVTSDGRIAWQTDPYDKAMNLIPDRAEYVVGDTAEVLVQNPFSVPVQAWVTLERGQLIGQRLVTLQPNSDIIRIPLDDIYAPNTFVTVTAVKPTDPNNPDDPYAEIRLGMAELVVNPDIFWVNIELTPQETVLEPRDTAVFDIRTTDHTGAPISADLSLALVDLAVLTLKPDNAPPILETFYERQPYRSLVGGGLFISGEGREVELPLAGGGLGGGGGDGIASESVALRDGQDEDDVRRDFRDTAYWQANLVTDADGRATVEIPLPDNLTTWRLTSKANTEVTLVGQNTADIVTTLPLLIRPVTPRFLTVGDTLQIGAVINNNTDSAIEADVTLEATGVTLNGPVEQTVNVPANGQVLVSWETAVNDATFVDGQAFADFTFRVSGGGYSDATKPTFGVGPDNLIPIYRYNAQDIVGTSGELDTQGSRVESILLPPGVDMAQGNVDMVLSPSLAAALLDSLRLHNNDLDFLADCPAAIADRMLPNVAVETLTTRLDAPEVEAQLGDEPAAIVDAGIGQLTALVHSDGGWAWCFEDESDPWITAYVLLALAKARQIGYAVDEELLEDAGNYLVRQLAQPEDFRTAFDANRQAFYLYVLAELGVDVNAELDALFTEARDLLDPYGKGLLLMAYHLTGSDTNVDALIADLSGSAIVSATGTHWEDVSQDFDNLSSDIRGTAMIVNALSLWQPDNALAPGAVRWLMAARTAAVWPTTHESAWTIFGLTEWMAATGELDANYEYGLQVNLQPTADGSFNRENIAESRQVTVPVPDLFSDDPNFFEFRRGAGAGTLYYTMHMNTAVNASQVSPINRGIHVERAYFDAACDPETETCEPITQIQAGQQVRVVVTIQTENDLLHAIIEDPIPAGTEAVDPNLETTPSGGGDDGPIPLDYLWGYWGWWSFDRVEYRDEKVVFLTSFLPAGTYQYTYFLDTVIPGSYQVMPTFAREAYFPEVNGRAAGLLFTIAE